MDPEGFLGALGDFPDNMDYLTSLWNREITWVLDVLVLVLGPARQRLCSDDGWWPRAKAVGTCLPHEFNSLKVGAGMSWRKVGLDLSPGYAGFLQARS